jgi:CspA family cold shock protein
MSFDDDFEDDFSKDKDKDRGRGRRRGGGEPEFGGGSDFGGGGGFRGGGSFRGGGGGDRPFRPRGEGFGGGDRPPRPPLGPEQAGVVKFFNAARGFGFITPDGGGTDVFVHVSAVERAGLPPLNEGQRITFQTLPDPKGKGPKAVNLKVAE